MRGDVGVSLQKPGVTRTRLEDQLATPRPAGLQVDERANLLGPDVLRDEAVTSLKRKKIIELDVIILDEVNLNDKINRKGSLSG